MTYDLLREALHLPCDTEIRHVGPGAYDTAEITVIHSDLNDVTLAEGELPPVVCPTFRRNVPVEFIEWGQK